jgi:zinc protease
VITLSLVGGLIAGCTSSDSEVSKGPTESVSDSPEPVTSEAPDTTVATSEPPQELAQFDRDFPVDDKVRIAKLDNGLTYYIRENTRPGAKVELRLVINAGSALEDQDQAATAHFLEHMMFNGTTKYPANDLVEVLQGFGSEFGPDVNAYTSYDETVYELSLPSTDSAVVETGFDILHEWLTSATLDPEQVTAERGVVLDEWRQSEQSFSGRIGQTISDLFFTGTAYEDRDPIGNDAAIEAMTPDLLRRFYDDWYRPDNAALVVVGDIDADTIEELITSTFADVADRGGSPARPALPLDPYTEPDVGILVDPETSDSLVEVTLPLPTSTDVRVTALRQQLLDALAFDIIATRLSDDQKQGGTPFTDATVASNSQLRAIDAPSLLVTAAPGKAPEAFDALTVEIERVRRDGVTDPEVARALAPYQSSARDDHEAQDTVQDVDYAGQYVDNFLTQSPIPDADAQFEIVQEVFDSVTADDVHRAFLARWTATAPRVLLVAPTSDGETLPTEEEVLGAWKALPEREIEPRADTSSNASDLMATTPESVEESSSDEVDGDPGWYVEPTLLTFPNGARVFLNPTKIEEGSVGLFAVSPGGLGVVADADVANAAAMTQVEAASGLGTLDAVELSQVLAGKSVSLDAYLDSATENLSGGGATDDLETLLQLTHLTLTDAKFDDTALADVITEVTPYIDDPTIEPEFAAQIALTDARYGTEPRMRLLPTAEEVATYDTVTMARIWAERFGNASDWTFALVGDFDVEEATQLVRQYIGSLPGDGTTETSKDVEIDPPTSVVQRDVLAGSGDKASLTVQFNGPTDGSRRDQALTDLVAEILTNRLTEHVREALGASYSPAAQSYLYDTPDLLVETSISVTGSAADIDRLSAVVQEDLAALRADGTGGAEWDAALATMTERYGYINNGVIAIALLASAQNPEYDLKGRLNIIEEFATIEVDDINQFIKRVLPADRYIEIRLLPA